MTYFKAVTGEGRDLMLGAETDYSAALVSGEWVEAGAEYPIHVYEQPGDLARYFYRGDSWPNACRYFEVEGEEVARDEEAEPVEVHLSRVRFVAEVPFWRLFGPQGEQVAALYENRFRIAPEALSAALVAFLQPDPSRRFNEFRETLPTLGFPEWSRQAAVDTIATALPPHLRTLVDLTISALVVRHLIDADLYDAVTGLWRTHVGELHPEDNGLVTV